MFLTHIIPTYQAIHGILVFLLTLWHTIQQKPSKTQGKQRIWMQPVVAANPFKNLVKINIFIKKRAAGRAHSRSSPGLRQGPASSDLHLSNSESRQCLHALEHHGKCDFYELPALARFLMPSLGCRQPTTKWNPRLNFPICQSK